MFSPMRLKVMRKQRVKWSGSILRFHKKSSPKRRIMRAFFILCWVAFLLPVLVIGPHWGLNVCPFHIKTFKRSQLVPVVYGLPTIQGLASESRGEIVLGGCMVGSLSVVC